VPLLAVTAGQSWACFADSIEEMLVAKIFATNALTRFSLMKHMAGLV